jgi:hypothetical protein
MPRLMFTGIQTVVQTDVLPFRLAYGPAYPTSRLVPRLMFTGIQTVAQTDILTGTRTGLSDIQTGAQTNVH